MRLLLQRFDVDQTSSLANTNNTNDHSNEDSNESNSSHPGTNEETNSFVRQLANCDKEELDDVMRQRVLLSTRAVSKVHTQSFLCFAFTLFLFHSISVRPFC